MILFIKLEKFYKRVPHCKLNPRTLKVRLVPNDYNKFEGKECSVVQEESTIKPIMTNPNKRNILMFEK